MCACVSEFLQPYLLIMKQSETSSPSSAACHWPSYVSMQRRSVITYEEETYQQANSFG